MPTRYSAKDEAEAQVQGLRDDSVGPPASKTQDGALVCLPDSPRPQDGQVPDNDKTIRVACQQPLIAADKCGGVNRCFVAPKNRLGMGRPFFRHLASIGLGRYGKWNCDE